MRFTATIGVTLVLLVPGMALGQLRSIELIVAK